MKSASFLFSAFISFIFFSSCNSNVTTFGSGVKGDGNIVTLERPIDKDIKRIESWGSFDITVNDAEPDGLIKITGDSNLLEHIETSSLGDNLHISLKKGKSINPSRTIKLSLNARTLYSAALNGSGDIFLENISSDRGIELSLRGSGDIKGNIYADQLSTVVAGSGDIEVSGEVKNLLVQITGSGDVTTYNLMADHSEVQLRGSGSARVFVNESLTANITGSGSIRYKGPAQKINSHVTGSGSIKKAD